MNTMKKIAIFLMLTAMVFGQAAVFNKVVLADPSALCLDGSPGAYYISRGKKPEIIIVHFEGGGWCGSKDLPTTLENCYARSKTDYGSSNAYPSTFSYSEGILSNNPKNGFADATKVFLKYCDGAGHQGSRTTPISYKGSQLFFRGHNITVAQLNSIEKTEGLFSRAVYIIVTGSSAGGLATFLWANYIRERATASAGNVIAVPDAGIFLDSPNYASKTNTYRQQFASLLKLSNIDVSIPVPECVAAYPGEPQKCMFAQNLHRFIKVPLFAIQSPYDSWSIPNILGISCPSGRSLQKCNSDEMDFIEQYHRNMTGLLMSIGRRPENGCWAPICVNHALTLNSIFYNEDFRIPMNSANSINAGLLSWIMKEDESHLHIDIGNWPENKPCSGISSNLENEME